jgi:hypothetical protein
MTGDRIDGALTCIETMAAIVRISSPQLKSFEAKSCLCISHAKMSSKTHKAYHSGYIDLDGEFCNSLANWSKAAIVTNHPCSKEAFKGTENAFCWRSRNPLKLHKIIYA